MSAYQRLYHSGGGQVVSSSISFVRNSECLQISRVFLPVKLVYFFFNGAAVSIMPFMAVFMLDLGLTPFQTGIARGAEPLLHLAVGPLWGSLSDRYSRHKTILIMAVVLPAVFYFSTQFVPPVKVTHCNSSFVSEIGDVWTRTHHQIQLKIDDVTIVPVGDGNDTNNARTRNRMGSWVDRVHQTQLKIDNSVLNQNLQRIPNDSLSSNGPPTESPSTTKPMKTQTDSTLTFLLMMLLVSGGRLFLSPFNPILDSTVVRMTKEHTGSDFGRQRMFASFGFGTFSVISGAAIDAFGRNYPDRNKYTPMFYMYASMLVLVLIPVSFMKFPPHSRPPQAIYRNVCALFLKLDFVAFLLAAFGSGFSLGAINTFLFIFIAELHGPHILMGLNLTVTCISEAACLFFSKQMIQWLGHKNIFIIVIFCYGVRHLAYSMIHNPWLVVPVALLHGICFGAFWPACTSYVNIIAPVGMEASVQSIAHSTYFGLGRGLGMIIGGVIYSRYGSRYMFRSIAAFCSVVLILLVLSKCYSASRTRRRELTMSVQYDEI